MRKNVTCCFSKWLKISNLIPVDALINLYRLISTYSVCLWSPVRKLLIYFEKSPACKGLACVTLLTNYLDLWINTNVEKNWSTCELSAEMSSVLYVQCPASVYFHLLLLYTGPHSTVANVPGNRCESDCRSRGREFDPSQVPYFRGDWSWNNFYGHSPSSHWIIQEGLLSVTSESMCTKYWLTACLSLPRKKCG